MHPKRSHRWVPTVTLAVLGIPLLAGCADMAAVPSDHAGLMQYRWDEAVHEFRVDLATAWDATLEALDRLGYPPARTVKLRDGNGKIQGAAYDVRLEHLPSGLTRIKVRVGRDYSERLQREGGGLLSEVASILNAEVQIREWAEQVKALSQPPGTATEP